MTWWSEARKREVRGLATDPPIVPVGVIFHVAASNSPSLFGWFDGPSGGIESHLHVPLTDAFPVEQYRSTDREADANYKGNSWTVKGTRYGFLSVETAGLGDGVWTHSQIERLVRFTRWAHELHRFPLRIAPGYRQGGLGYHTMFGAGPGTDSWSNARGKLCPGSRRVEQFHDVLVPALCERKTLPGAPVQTSRDEGLDVIDAQTKTYLDEQFASLAGSRKRDAAGKVVDDDPQRVSTADVLTFVEVRVLPTLAVAVAKIGELDAKVVELQRKLDAQPAPAAPAPQ